jgi:hypothetical protein
LAEDSVVQFLNLCQGLKYNLTPRNVFEIELLCKEWRATPSLCKRVEKFINHPPGGGTLEVAKLLFYLKWGLCTKEIEDFLRLKLIDSVGDELLRRVPVPVLARIVNFRQYEGNSELYDKLFTFCIQYYGDYGPLASVIFMTCDVTRLSTEQLRRLFSLAQLQWGVLNESARRAMIELLSQCDQQREQISGLQKQLATEKMQNDDLQKQLATEKMQNDDLQKQLATEKTRNDDLREQLAEQQRCNKEECCEMDALLRRMMLHPEDAIPEKIMRRCFPNSKEFPPLVGQSEVPDGIIAYLTRQCGGNVHNRQIVTVTSSSHYRCVWAEKSAAQNVADLETASNFRSVYCGWREDIRNSANNWICYDFKNQRILPTHYAVRSPPSG